MDYDIDLKEYWAVLVRRRMQLLYMIGAALVLSAAVSLLLPATYAATARVLPPPQKGSLTSSVMAGLAKNADFAPDALLDTNKSSDLWAEILASRSVEDAVIGRFKLQEVYARKTAEEARADLEENVVIKRSKAGIVSIMALDRSPERAAGIANAFVDELDRVNKNVSMSSGTRARLFLEGRVEETKHRLQDAENALNQFQEKNGALKLDEQSGAVIKAIGSAKGELLAKQVELHTLLTYATPDNPKVGLVKAQIEGLNREVGRMEVAGGGQGGKDVFMPASRYPGLALQYARLLREVKVQQSLYESLVMQYEEAKIAEAKDSPTVSVLDRAAVPTKKAKPARFQLVFIATTLASFFSVITAFAMERREKSGRG